MFLVTYIFLLRLPSECLPIRWCGNTLSRGRTAGRAVWKRARAGAPAHAPNAPGGIGHIGRRGTPLVAKAEEQAVRVNTPPEVLVPRARRDVRRARAASVAARHSRRHSAVRAVLRVGCPAYTSVPIVQNRCGWCQPIRHPRHTKVATRDRPRGAARTSLCPSRADKGARRRHRSRGCTDRSNKGTWRLGVESLPGLHRPRSGREREGSGRAQRRVRQLGQL